MKSQWWAEGLDPATLDRLNELLCGLAPYHTGTHVPGGSIQHGDNGNWSSLNLKPDGVGQKALVELVRTAQSRLRGLWWWRKSMTGWAVVVIGCLDNRLRRTFFDQNLPEVSLAWVIEVPMESGNNFVGVGGSLTLELAQDPSSGSR